MVSRDPLDVEIIRKGRQSINPCARSLDSDNLDLRQLKWANENGHFWFLGPIQALEVNLRSKKINGTLALMPDGTEKFGLRAIFKKSGAVDSKSLILSIEDQSSPDKIIAFINN